MSDGFAGRYEVLSDRGGGRRTWSDEAKLRIVAESHAPGAMVSEFARRHRLMPSQVTTWRRLHREGKLGLDPVVTPPAFVALVMAEPEVAPARPAPDTKNEEVGRIEIQVGDDMVIRLPPCTPAVRIAEIASALRARYA